MYKVTGPYYNREVTVAWDKGELVCSDPMFVTEAKMYEQRKIEVGLPGANSYGPARLSDPASAMAVILNMMEWDDSITAVGDVPELESLPKGVVA